MGAHEAPNESLSDVLRYGQAEIDQLYSEYVKTTGNKLGDIDDIFRRVPGCIQEGDLEKIWGLYIEAGRIIGSSITLFLANRLSELTKEKDRFPWCLQGSHAEFIACCEQAGRKLQSAVDLANNNVGHASTREDGKSVVAAYIEAKNAYGKAISFIDMVRLDEFADLKKKYSQSGRIEGLVTGVATSLIASVIWAFVTKAPENTANAAQPPTNAQASQPSASQSQSIDSNK